LKNEKDCQAIKDVTNKQKTKECEEPSCTKNGSMSCGRCKSASYCSKVCQKKDWKRHKKDCGDGVSTNACIDANGEGDIRDIIE